MIWNGGATKSVRTSVNAGHGFHSILHTTGNNQDVTDKTVLAKMKVNTNKEVNNVLVQRIF